MFLNGDKKAWSTRPLTRASPDVRIIVTNVREQVEHQVVSITSILGQPDNIALSDKVRKCVQLYLNMSSHPNK